MELMKQDYHDIIFMPVLRFQNLIKWKSTLEEERNKLMKEHEDKLISAAKQRQKQKR